MMIKLREFEGKNSLLIISVDRLTGFKNIRKPKWRSRLLKMESSDSQVYFL